MNYKVSIIIPVHNVENYLRRCIDSIISQNYDNFEILAIDDRSSDRSGIIIDEYTKIDNRVKSFHINQGMKGGVSIARNIGIDNATGDIVLFLDSDDSFEKDILADVVGDFNNNIDMVFYGLRRFGPSGRIISTRIYNDETYSYGAISTILPKLELSYVLGKSFRKEIIDKNKLRFREDFQLGEDMLFVNQYFLAIEKSIKTSSAIIYNYVQWNKHSLSTKYVDNIETIYSEIGICKELLSKYSGYQYPYSKETLISINVIQNLYSRNSPVKRKERIRIIKDFIGNKIKYKSIVNGGVRNKSDKLRIFLFSTKRPRFIDLILSIIRLSKKILR